MRNDEQLGAGDEPSTRAWDFLTRVRLGGLGAALGAFGLAIILGVADQFTTKIVPAAASYLEGVFRPPHVVLTLTEPLPGETFDLKVQRVTDSPVKPLAPAKFEVLDRRTYKVKLDPGTYRAVILVRDAGQVFTISDTRRLTDSGSIWPFDTARTRWETVNEATRAAVVPVASGSAVLEATRYAPIDEDVHAAVGLPSDRSRLLYAALAQVGVREDGPPADKARIAGYWSAAPQFSGRSEGDLLALPWGGAFLGWITREAGFEPPAAPASFTNWTTWGEPTPGGKPVPGAIVVFDASAPTGALSEIRSRLLAGVVVRQRENCVDVIAGNVANRVVVTCIGGKVVAVRSPLKPRASVPPPPRLRNPAVFIGDADDCRTGRLQAMQIGSVLPGRLGVFAAPIPDGGRTRYDMYFAGGTLEEAQMVCAAMRRRGGECEVVERPRNVIERC